MKALTIYQPWAWAICHAGKRIENRGWRPPARLMGARIAIHAGKRLDRDALPAIRDAVRAVLDRDRFDSFRIPNAFPIGAVVAAAVLQSCVTEPPDLQGPWWVGPYGWILSEVEVLPSPVRCRGQQGLWDLPPEVEAEVAHQLGKRESDE